MGGPGMKRCLWCSAVLWLAKPPDALEGCASVPSASDCASPDSHTTDPAFVEQMKCTFLLMQSVLLRHTTPLVGCSQFQAVACSSYCQYLTPSCAESSD